MRRIIKNFQNRIGGAIYGALVGDALGVPVEFTEREEHRAKPVREMRGGGTWGQLPGTWSDDGALLLCTAEGITENAPAARIGRLYIDWMRTGHWAARGAVFDIGGTTQNSLSRLADGIPLEPPSEFENGNGSLMRILPVGLHVPPGDEAALFRRAMDLSALTHAHIRSQLACAFYCLIVSHLIEGTSLPEAHALASSRFEALLAIAPRERTQFARLLEPEFARTPESLIKSSGYVVHTLEAALWCALNQPDFPNTVLAAVNLGGDTDTTGCVAGGLAGALHGFDAIPFEWLDVLPHHEDVDALLTRFTAACAENRR